MAYGVVIGGGLQLFFQLPSLRRTGFSFRPHVDFSHPGLRQILTLMGPAILGTAATQINVMVNTNFASRIDDPIRGPDGAVSWLAYAFRFMQLPLGLFGVALASATLPSISRSAASGNMGEFRRTLSRSIGMVFLLTIPSSAGLAVLGKSMIGLIYQGGEFNDYDTQQTAIALSCYAVGLGGYSALKILAPAFYALDDARTPMLISFISIVINYVVVSLAIDAAGFGHAGLALSTSVVAIFGFLALFLIIRKRIGGIYGRELFATIMKVTFASALMACVVTASSHLVGAWLGASRLSHALDLLLSIPLGIAVYYFGCRMVGVPEMQVAFSALASPLQRLRSRIM
jgi:putative peptidoglycan lipid II flippase